MTHALFLLEWATFGNLRGAVSGERAGQLWQSWAVFDSQTVRYIHPQNFNVTRRMNM